MGGFWFLIGCVAMHNLIRTSDWYAVELIPSKVFVEGSIDPEEIDSFGYLTFRCVVTISNSSNRTIKVDKVRLDCKDSKYIRSYPPKVSFGDALEISPHRSVTFIWFVSQDHFPTTVPEEIEFQPRIRVYLPSRFDLRREFGSRFREVLGRSKSVKLLVED